MFFHQNLSTPVLNIMSSAHGIYIEDFDGKKYIDMHGNGVHNAGFNNPDVIKAVKAQLDEKLTFCPRRYSNVKVIELAEKIIKTSPTILDKVLFCPGGSEAIEMAIILAITAISRTKLHAPSNSTVDTISHQSTSVVIVGTLSTSRDLGPTIFIVNAICVGSF